MPLQPSSSNSVAFSSSIEIIMEIYVTTEKKTSFELFRSRFKLNLLNIWGNNLGNQCCGIDFKGEDVFTHMHFMLIKDVVVATVEIMYKTKTIASEACGYKVRGQLYAYYGYEIPDHVVVQ